MTGPGFRTASAENVVLRVAQTLTVNISLEVGQVSEQVTVSAETPLLETGTAEIGRGPDHPARGPDRVVMYP